MSKSPAARPKRIGIVGFDGVAALDLTCAVEAFSIANGTEWKAAPTRYIPIVAAPKKAAIASESGLHLLPDTTLDAAPPFDTIVVPGGPGLREAATNAAVAAWLRKRAKTTRRMVSVCTGFYGLAAGGLLNGRRATTHWLHAADAARRFPDVKLEPDALFIRDGKFYTSAGMTAAIDLSLALIEEDHGPSVAMTAARQMVVYMKRAGGQLQYSEPLRFQTRAGDRFADLVSRMVGDLGADWTVETMAAQTGLSVRQFTRRFKNAFAMTPARYVEMLRLDEARLRLATGTHSMARIAHAAGFQSDDAFRRAFERRFGLTPGAYRGRFAAHTDTPSPKDRDRETPYRH